MKKILVVVIVLFFQLQVKAECILSVAGGFGSAATMGYYFSNFKLKDGWIAKWDPSLSGDASIVFNQDKWNENAFGINVTSSASLITKNGETKIRSSGFGYMSWSDTCGQPALGRGYSKSITKFRKKLLRALPQCHF